MNPLERIEDADRGAGARIRRRLDLDRTVLKLGSGKLPFKAGAFQLFTFQQVKQIGTRIEGLAIGA